ncbi:hypothetical protein OIV83_000411 [Microbotryomycetes sp. JL201]|nr:hypothetical protein OIV83_000411 [Microbotryomycetes sp. JL201]
MAGIGAVKVQGDALAASPTNERVIRPLPKRQRLADIHTASLTDERKLSASVRDRSRKAGAARARSAEDEGGRDDDEQDDERSHQEHERLRAMQLHASSNSTLPALQDRSRHDDDDYHAGRQGARGSALISSSTAAVDDIDASSRTAVHLSRLRLDDSYDTDDNNTARTSLEPSISSTHVNDNSDSPFTSPAGSHSGGGASQDDEAKMRHRATIAATATAIERAPTDYALFGDEGILIRKALVNAHLYSSAGLCGGLGLAGLHPALPELADLTTGPTVAAHVGQHDEDVDEDPDSKYDARPVGSNKKKRKIPGMSLNGPADDVEGPHYDIEDGPEPTTVVGPGGKGRAPGGVSRLKAPANPPKTAKAALAKLRVKPPHVSSCSLCLSHRRHLREMFRRAEKQPPLALDPPATFYPPPVPKDGPPPLPPGSGLKGSKALKAAKKAEKERQKEKERMKEALGGPDLKLVDLFDPIGLERERRNHLKFRSTDERTFRPPDGFEGFRIDIPGVPSIMDRWNLLQDQIEQLASAKRRAKEARDLVQERRKEQERDYASQSASLDGTEALAQTDGAADPAVGVDTGAAETIAAAAAPAPSPLGEPAAKPRRNSKVSPTTYTQEAPQPLSAKKTSSKKGKKKRSAHANALNVHHRNNYVPSRAPASAMGQHHGRGEDGHAMFWPPSDEALAAAGGGRGDLSWFSGPDEWLCALCEYDLLFGDVDKAVKQRRRVLKIRRKAKQRASKATAGAIAGAASGGLGDLTGTGSTADVVTQTTSSSAETTALPEPEALAFSHDEPPWTNTNGDPVE